MRSFLYALLAALPAATGDTRMTQPAAPRVVAIIGATVLTMERGGVELRDQTILVRGDRIARVGPRTRVPIPADAQRIEARGRWVMPGLVDAHAHLDGAEATVARDLPLYLVNSVTTIRNMRGRPMHLRLREHVRRGTLPGPSILTTGAFLERLPAHVPAAAHVAAQREAGYDAVKMHGQDLGRERWLEFARAARAASIPLVGHVPLAVGVETAAREGQRTLEHAEDLMQVFFRSQLDTTRFDALAAALRAGAPGTPRPCVVPTLVVFGYVVRNFEEAPGLAALMARPELRFVREELRAAWRPERNPYVRALRGRSAAEPALLARLRTQYAFMRAMTAALHRAGVPVALGSDAGVAYTLPGYSAVEELALLRTAGLGPTDALAAGTRVAAECLGLGRETGRVVEGLRADLVLLDEDPRAAVTTLGRPAGVLVRGAWLPRERLVTMLKEGRR